MNKAETKKLSLAANRLLIENQVLTEKLEKQKKQSLKFKKKSALLAEKLENEKTRSAVFEDMVLGLLSRYERRCPCNDVDACESPECIELAAKVAQRTLEREQEEAEAEMAAEAERQHVIEFTENYGLVDEAGESESFGSDSSISEFEI